MQAELVVNKGYQRVRRPRAPKGSFGDLLREFREEKNMSRNALAHMSGCDPSYITRTEFGDREPPRQHIVESIARALGLAPQESNRLLAAAGHCPPSVNHVGGWGPAFQALVSVLGNPLISQSERQEFEQLVVSLGKKWGPSKPTWVNTTS